MTVISALIRNEGTVVSSDSLISVNLNGKQFYVEWNRSKIIQLPKFRGTVSYWGFAGTFKRFDESSPENSIWDWSMYDFLLTESKNPSEENVEDFVANLCTKLENEYKKIKFPKTLDSGIGIHITAYEYIEDYWIPELFLLSNFKEPTYQKIGKIDYSRNTYHTIFTTEPQVFHKEKQYRLKVKQYLTDGGMIWYNNGDPEFYNVIASSIFGSFNLTKIRNKLKAFKSVIELVPLAKRPIEIIAQMQSDFYKSDKRIVGGRIHDIAVNPNGNYFSTSGDL